MSQIQARSASNAVSICECQIYLLIVSVYKWLIFLCFSSANQTTIEPKENSIETQCALHLCLCKAKKADSLVAGTAIARMKSRAELHP